MFLGTTGVGAIDPLRPIGEICRRHGVYLHVDAAWAGNGLVLPENRWMIDGIEHVIAFSEKDGKLLWASQPEPVAKSLDELVDKQLAQTKPNDTLDYHARIMEQLQANP